ncbi:hypothetical protein [Paenibacillus sp. YPG26]|uniref:hypothetical protein n=1 Tax=Paenibacillus sp. YPG26 TaxID=2878915 RepID=UPI002041E462|nr:hypothetical protein [Paenibacillus sp. YPG26]USB32652.1 hypothetical protein LDO05_15465 [Paenibacillus sp. YPG26]
MRISQLSWDLIFITTGEEHPDLQDIVEAELAGLDEHITWYVEVKRQDHLLVAVAEGKGLTVCESEEQFLSFIDPRLNSPCWDWLSGYSLQVVPQEDAGSCRMKEA